MQSKSTLKWIPIFLTLPLVVYILLNDFDPFINRFFLSLTLIATAGGYSWIHLYLYRNKQILLSLFSAWSLILAAWFDAFGNIFLLYEEFFWYDDLGHFIGVFVITAFVLEIFSKLSMRKNWQLPFFHLGLYAFSLAMLIATIYEITEWIGDLYFGTYRITARLDSASDLWWGFVGGILALAIWRLQKKFKTSD